MALDWSKRFSSLGLRRRSARTHDEYPSKTYMNMVLPDMRETTARNAVVVAAPLVVLLLVLAKFGVIDFYARVVAKSAELTRATDELQQVEQQLVDYDSVLEEYRTYESARMTANAGDVAAVDALALVDAYVMPAAQVDSIELRSGQLTLALSDTSLDAVGGLVSTLYQQPIVKGVQVATAANGRDTNAAIVTMTITLQSEAAAEVAAETAATAQDAS